MHSGYCERTLRNHWAGQSHVQPCTSITVSISVEAMYDKPRLARKSGLCENTMSRLPNAMDKEIH